MATCPKCGSEVVEGAKFCANCGSEMIEKEPESTGETKFCANCGFEMDRSTKFCPNCGTSTTGGSRPNNTTHSVSNPDKSPVLALILSFFIIGLGQIYLGLNKKGIILFIIAVVAGVLTLFIIGWVIWLLVWLYAMYDAYNSANKMNNGEVLEDTIDFDNLF